MLIFYQIRSKHIKTVDLSDQTCTTCKNKGVLKMHFFQNYLWLFGPIAPAGKHATIECTVCNTTLPNKKWTKELDAIYKKEIKTIKTPLKMWRGFVILWIFILGILFYVYQSFTTPNDYQTILNNKEVNLANIKNFKEGDVLFISILEKNKNYPISTVAKVEKIEGNKTTLVKYEEEIQYFKQIDLHLSDIDPSKFNQEIEVKTDAIRKTGELENFKPNSKLYKDTHLGEATVVIK